VAPIEGEENLLSVQTHLLMTSSVKDNPLVIALTIKRNPTAVAEIVSMDQLNEH
jgi:hypothetical protein